MKLRLGRNSTTHSQSLVRRFAPHLLRCMSACADLVRTSKRLLLMESIQQLG